MPGSRVREVDRLGWKCAENLVAVVNGLFGDTLDDRDSRWSTPMTIRVGDTVLALDQSRWRSASSSCPG